MASCSLRKLDGAGELVSMTLSNTRAMQRGCLGQRIGKGGHGLLLDELHVPLHAVGPEYYPCPVREPASTPPPIPVRGGDAVTGATAATSQLL